MTGAMARLACSHSRIASMVAIQDRPICESPSAAALLHLVGSRLTRESASGSAGSGTTPLPTDCARRCGPGALPRQEEAAEMAIKAAMVLGTSSSPASPSRTARWKSSEPTVNAVWMPTASPRIPHNALLPPDSLVPGNPLPNRAIRRRSGARKPSSGARRPSFEPARVHASVRPRCTSPSPKSPDTRSANSRSGIDTHRPSTWGGPGGPSVVQGYALGVVASRSLRRLPVDNAAVKGPSAGIRKNAFPRALSAAVRTCPTERTPPAVRALCYIRRGPP